MIPEKKAMIDISAVYRNLETVKDEILKKGKTKLTVNPLESADQECL